MLTLQKEASISTPAVLFDQKTGVLRLTGKSLPMYEEEYFLELMQWVEYYVLAPNHHTKVEIDLKYMNAKSIRLIRRLLQKLQQLTQAGHEVEIEWSIPKSAEDMLELSEDVLIDIHMPHVVILS